MVKMVDLVAVVLHLQAGLLEVQEILHPLAHRKETMVELDHIQHQIMVLAVGVVQELLAIMALLLLVEMVEMELHHHYQVLLSRMLVEVAVAHMQVVLLEQAEQVVEVMLEHQNQDHKMLQMELMELQTLVAVAAVDQLILQQTSEELAAQVALVL
jgi:hypothetical protein